jgi:hypothetical protein
MPSTSKGFPYPASSDPVAQGAAAIQALAEFIDPNTGITGSGEVNLDFTSDTSRSAVVTFVAGRFSAAPHVVATNGGPRLIAAVYGITAAHFSLTVYTASGSAVTASNTTQWIARE